MKAPRHVLVICLFVLSLVSLSPQASAQTYSPRSFSAQQKARRDAEDRARREAEVRERETAASARREAESQARKERSQEVSEQLATTSAKLDLYNKANSKAAALGYMRKLTVQQTLDDGVLCFNETVTYRWKHSIEDSLRYGLKQDVVIEKTRGEMFFLSCDTSEMYDGFVFRCFVRPNGFFQYQTPLGTTKKVRQFRLSTQEERQAALDELGDQVKYVTYEGKSVTAEPTKNAGERSKEPEATR